ncbi:voltage-dependent N-type calcium channel subunit alpha-1B, putative [Babesia caballi]|uniref:Voltage-dependent N-type calcium channel subunit alpha-1B, putative n=1 Tax=Babesia caballi TaxID=5871 RepID=A0AAV4LMM3_BABCB|nr:voltage-dependent N-type calcium channel subunit alpha-1B, putative [Babesia caballi]
MNRQTQGAVTRLNNFIWATDTRSNPDRGRLPPPQGRVGQQQLELRQHGNGGHLSSQYALANVELPEAQALVEPHLVLHPAALGPYGHHDGPTAVLRRPQRRQRVRRARVGDEPEAGPLLLQVALQRPQRLEELDLGHEGRHALLHAEHEGLLEAPRLELVGLEVVELHPRRADQFYARHAHAGRILHTRRATADRSPPATACPATLAWEGLQQGRPRAPAADSDCSTVYERHLRHQPSKSRGEPQGDNPGVDRRNCGSVQRRVDDAQLQLFPDIGL